VAKYISNATRMPNLPMIAVAEQATAAITANKAFNQKILSSTFMSAPSSRKEVNSLLRVKRSVSNFDIAILLSEIAQSVIGAWINNIYQIMDFFLFKLNTKFGDKTLLVDPGRRIHLTKYQRSMPKAPTNFCSALRKHVRNGHIENIVQYDLDRVVIMTIITHSDKLKLIIELFGEGNLILCDSEDKIIMAKHYRIMRDRSIKPKDVFMPPPPRGINLASLSESEISSIFDSSSTGLVETLASKLNIDPLYAEEICAVSETEKNRKSRELTEEEKTRVAKAIQLTLGKLMKGPYEPQTIRDTSGRLVATAPFHLKLFEGLPAKRMDSYNDAMDEFFSTVEAGTARSQEVGDAEKETEEMQNVINEQRKKISESEELERSNRKFGELIYANLTNVEGILTVIRSARKSGISWQEIETKLDEAKREGVALADKIGSIDAREGTVTLELAGEKITLNIRLSAAKNASRFYESAKKAETKKEGAESALQDTLRKLSGLKTETTPSKEEVLREKRLKKWYEHFRWFISSNGFLIIGGRDSKTNEIIVKKRLEPTDIFVHADVHGAPVTVIKSMGKDVPETTITEACQFAASYSRLWKLGTGAGEAYWVRGNQVSFSPPSGEYLQKGSFIIKGERTYAKSIRLVISVGIITDEEKHVVPIAGPPSSIALKTRTKVDLVPGGESGSRLANLVKDRLIKLVSPELGAEIGRISLDEFLLILPPGGARLEQ
jgi:predicted ribosome quality control (RQC) complex YloA/Tae2 family protein